MTCLLPVEQFILDTQNKNTLFSHTSNQTLATRPFEAPIVVETHTHTHFSLISALTFALYFSFSLHVQPDPAGYGEKRLNG